MDAACAAGNDQGSALVFVQQAAGGQRVQVANRISAEAGSLNVLFWRRVRLGVTTGRQDRRGECD